MQQMHKISDDLATISMISDERTMIFFCLGIIVSHREVPKVGVVNRLRMRIVHNLVEFPPPLIALHPPLPFYQGNLLFILRLAFKIPIVWRVCGNEKF